MSEFVVGRLALLTQARNQGKSGSALFDLLVTDAREQGSGPVASSGGAGSGGGVAGSDGGVAEPPVTGLSAMALSRALGEDAFVQAAEQIAAKDTTTASGRRIGDVE